jgi:hypothetical protein
MHGDAPATSPSVLRPIAVLLLAADVLFLWMFFAADSVSQMGHQGRVSGAAVPDLALAASRFAAQWKHGMAGNSPLYMPGFFAVGFTLWLWSVGRSLRRLATEWTILAAIATVIAAGLAPLGATRAIGAFERAFSVSCVGPPPGFTLASLALSLFTLFTWSVTLVGLQLAIGRRSVAPLIAPAVLYVPMLELRPWALNDFTTQWIADVSRANPVAILSLVAIPALLGLLITYQFRLAGAAPARRQAWENTSNEDLP